MCIAYNTCRWLACHMGVACRKSPPRSTPIILREGNSAMTVSRLAYGSGGRRQQETVSRGVTAGFANGVADTDVAEPNRGLVRVEEAAEWVGLSHDGVLARLPRPASHRNH